MNQRYSTALQLSLFIVLIFSLIVGVTIYFYSGSFALLIEAINYVLICQLALLISSFVLIQLIIENFILTKVKSLYQDLLPTGIPLKEDSLQKDVISITQSLQKFAKESKLEIELLKDKENYRREFIGNLAHELKTPLFTVQGFIFTLLDNDINDEKTVKKYLKKAANGVDRLGFIIKDLDLITQFEAGIQNLEIKRFNLVDLVNNVFELLEMQAAKYNITLQFDTQYSAPIWVSADEERIMQVITNLIVNSLKYGVKNGLTEVGFTLVNDQKVIVSVRDNGEGIDEDHLPRLFERFYRIDKSGNRKQGGSGLGLSIVKHIIEAHQEKIYVKSSPGVGSEFSFSLQVEAE